MIHLANRAFGNLVAGLGYPIPNESIPTAQVQVNIGDSRIEFHMNPHFIHKLRDSEIAAVLAHEAFHVALDHLREAGDKVAYPEREVLADAHECIINDGLPGNIGFTTMDGTYKGLERYNQDFSLFSSKQGYDFIIAQREEDQKDEQDDSDKDDSKDKSDQNGDSKNDSESGKGEDSEKDDSSKDEDSDKDDSDKGDDSDSDSGDEKDDSDKGDSGKDDKSDSDSDGDSDGDSDSDANGDQPGDGAGTGTSGDQGSSCHGIAIIGEGDVDADDLKKIIVDTVTKAVNGVDTEKLPADLQDALEDLADELGTPRPGYSEAPPKDGFQVIDRFSTMNMNWVKLLQIINPKLRDHGRPKYKDSWHAPRRRMLHSYPNVILPTNKRLDAPKGKGDSIPSFIIALDMSVSIPERLLQDLAALAMSIPPELIKAFPITWSDGFRVFDPQRPREIVHRSGTQVQAIMNYANQLEKETSIKPYVLVITDGQYGVPTHWNKAEVKEKWFWMGIQKGDRAYIQNSTGDWTSDDHIFNLSDFTS